ncbi:MAG: hypothetical protein IKF78_12965 [Atopobiaceae bacterium]|nr:hypothetical protein [Atopobiaceae bacterium]
MGEGGIKIAHELPTSDYVYLFSTKSSAKVNMAVLVNHNLSNLKIFDVPEGSQSVDKHLLAYLGFLIGKHATKAKYVIISKDTAYDAISAFWTEELGVSICRQQTILPATKQKKTAVSPAKALAKKTDSGNQIKNLAQKKTALNASIMKTLMKSSYDNNVRGKAASIAVKHYASTERKRLTHDALVSDLGQARGSDIYNRIKHLL